MHNPNVAAMKSYVFSRRRCLLSLLRAVLQSLFLGGVIYLSVIYRYRRIIFILAPLAFLAIIIGFLTPILRLHRTLRILRNSSQLEAAAEDCAAAEPRIGDRCRIGERYFFSRDKAWILPLANVAEAVFRYDDSRAPRLDLTLRMKDGREHTVMRCPSKHPAEELRDLRDELNAIVQCPENQPGA